MAGIGNPNKAAFLTGERSDGLGTDLGKPARSPAASAAMPKKRAAKVQMNFRLDAEIAERIDAAAAAKGMTMTDYVTGILAKHS